jgi:N utilization substance protein B
MIGARTKARQFAMQILYQIYSRDGNLLGISKDDLPRIVSDFWLGVHERLEPDMKDYCENLVRGVVDHAAAIDGLIEHHAQNWKIARMARVDLSILRLAAYELGFASPEVPREVAINEAIELSKRFSTRESAPFVNGILDAMAKAAMKGSA